MDSKGDGESRESRGPEQSTWDLAKQIPKYPKVRNGGLGGYEGDWGDLRMYRYMLGVHIISMYWG